MEATMETYKVTLVRSNNKKCSVVLLANSGRKAELMAPDFLTYKAREPKALPIRAELIVRRFGT
jgi:hypothetical protein